jgi:hypothetical protein
MQLKNRFFSKTQKTDSKVGLFKFSLILHEKNYDGSRGGGITA